MTVGFADSFVAGMRFMFGACVIFIVMRVIWLCVELILIITLDYTFVIIVVFCWCLSYVGFGVYMFGLVWFWCLWVGVCLMGGFVWLFSPCLFRGYAC